MSVLKKIAIGFAVATVAALIQLALWEFFKPLIWVLFYPAAFLAAGWGGLICGLSAGVFAVLYAFFVFIEPNYSFEVSKLYDLRTALLFFPVIYFISDLQERYNNLRTRLIKDLKISEDGRREMIDLYEKNELLKDINFPEFADSLPQIVWLTDGAGKNIYFNSVWMRYTGMSLAESLGDGWNKPFHPDDKERAWDAWMNATKNKVQYSLECRLRKSDGSYRWWLIRGIPLIASSGRIERWFGTCTDIDEIKNISADLVAEKNRLQTIFDNSPDGLAIVDSNGQFAIFDNQFAKYFGFDDKSKICLDYMQFTTSFEIMKSNGERLQQEQFPVRQALLGNVVHMLEVFLKDKATGRSWYGSHSAAPIRDSIGKVTGAVLTVSDVSSRVRADIERTNLINDQSLILESGIVGVAKTKDRDFLWVNRAFADNFGYTPEELLGKSVESQPKLSQFRSFTR